MATTKKSNKDLMVKLRKRYRIMVDADRDNREAALDDFQFINVPDGLANTTSFGQWDQNMLRERAKRPAYTFNKLRVTMKRIVNDIRANTPSAKVRGVEDGDTKTAEVYEGLIRNICNVSDLDSIVDGAANYQVCAGYGAWRITTEYSKKNIFNQDIKIEEIPNPFCLYSDPSAKDALKTTARDWILTEKIPKSEFEAKYPKAEAVDFDDEGFDDDDDWSEGEEVRVAEYWYKVPTEVEFWQLNDGKVVDATSEAAELIDRTTIKTTRKVKQDKIYMCIASGDSILEGPTPWAGSEFPFIPLYGEHFQSESQNIWYGAGRWAKDAQRSYNIARTSIAETINQAPQAKFWTTAKQAEGHEKSWKEAHAKNFPFLAYNPDAMAPGPPVRMDASVVPIALIQESQLASEEINMTTGRYQNDVGAPNPASSGKQELIRNNQGELATYNYPDQCAKAISRTWSLLIDLLPHVYDAERSMRILGKDGAEDYVMINTFETNEAGEQIAVNDLSQGSYDVVVTPGPSYATKRMEAAESYQQLLQGNPDLMQIIGDLVFKSLDLPYADEISERLKTLLPPQIQQAMQEGNEAMQSPAVMQAMQQAQMAMQQVEQQSQMLQEQGAEVQKEAHDVDIAKQEVEKLLAKLDTAQQQFEAKVAKATADVAKKDARLTMDKLNNESEGIIEGSKQEAAQAAMAFNQALAQDVAGMMQQIQAIASQLGEVAVGAIGEMKIEKEKPRVVKVVEGPREGGKMTAVPVYEDEPTSIN